MVMRISAGAAAVKRDHPNAGTWRGGASSALFQGQHSAGTKL
jgi:hypothetical protein